VAGNVVAAEGVTDLCRDGALLGEWVEESVVDADLISGVEEVERWEGEVAHVQLSLVGK
jgi:hypothetical protein